MSTDEVDVTISIPEKVRFSVRAGRIEAEGPLGKTQRPFPNDALEVTSEKGTIRLTLKIPPHRKQSRALLHTWAAHVRNLAGGLTQGVEARMKVVAAHFPMKVQAKGETLVIENFLGEKQPRVATLRAGTSAAVEGDIVILSGNDLEQVGQSAANVERTTHIREYDPRVFQDGIYLIERAHLKEAS
jgi:large subunit ribosomal protein L6